MACDASATSYPSDLDEHIEEYIREDYWANYDFNELIEDISCTVYSDYVTAHEIQCALQKAAEAEDVTWFKPFRIRNSIIIKYQIGESHLITKNIRFEFTHERGPTGPN